jgi:hypothetical protein
MQKLFLKAKKFFIINRANMISCSLGWTIFDANEEWFYEICAEPLFSHDHF